MDKLSEMSNIQPILPDYSKLLNQITVRESTSKQEFNFGDINIQKCDDENQFVQGIMNGGLRSAINQEKSKR